MQGRIFPHRRDGVEQPGPGPAAARERPHVQVLQHGGAALPRRVRGEVQRVPERGRGAARGLRHLAEERGRLEVEAVALQVCNIGRVATSVERDRNNPQRHLAGVGRSSIEDDI